MSFKVRMFDIIQPTFRQNCEVIWQCTQLPAMASFTAHKLRKAIMEQTKKASEIQKKTLKKYAVCDEKGEPVFDPKTGTCTFKEENGAELFTKEFEELSKETEVTIKAKKLDFKELVQVQGLQPTFWDAIEPILENVPQD